MKFLLLTEPNIDYMKQDISRRFLNFISSLRNCSNFKPLLIIIAIIGIGTPVYGENNRKSLSDTDSLYVSYLLSIVSPQESIGDYCTAFAHLLIGTPYVSGTLDGDSTERLVANMQELDCTTFAESVLALARTATQGRRNTTTFCDELQQIRYRRGIIAGYSSRLHYFSDWIADGEAMGLVHEISREIGGEPKPLHLNYMSRHADRYPALQRDSTLIDSIAVQEARLSNDTIYYIPTAHIDRKTIATIHDGDIIAFTCDIEGLDVAHVGIATRDKERVYIIHASSSQGKVVKEVRHLQQQLSDTRRFTGIRVIRPTYRQ